MTDPNETSAPTEDNPTASGLPTDGVAADGVAADSATANADAPDEGDGEKVVVTRGLVIAGVVAVLVGLIGGMIMSSWTLFK